ncbi:type II toxin-antitoxin system Phd/YefM family antitoxin [Caulobacter sp. 602-2]|uniref:Antitoxin n=1 Tax=Caulobacter sp. 602-2 TaxID=2710887 RepID=A0A6G4QZA2_9CAUL|nr:type II toxin-antitoxin system Phd/YefM family antitoxin [Caulobacter sp. 602-2]NGM50813.1 type II toxin-antitoxin system Phd/YefM family antitoxin [Caulobacter sp. 602-2]
MREVGVLEAKTHLSALLDAVEKGGEAVLITRNGRPVAKLSPAEEATIMPRRASAAELAERFKALRERIAAANPDAENLTWEQLKEDARR